MNGGKKMPKKDGLFLQKYSSSYSRSSFGLQSSFLSWGL